MQSAQLPVVAFSRATFKASRDGVFVFTGTTSTLTVTAEYGAANIGDDLSNLYVIKNRGSGNLTVATAGVNFYDGSSVSTLTLLPGQSVVLQYDGTYFAVVAGQGTTAAGAANLAAFQTPTTVAALPAAASSQGQRRTVTDANVAYSSANLATTVAAGGANVVPVWCNGTNWLIG